jgi:hypothetical protein
MFRQCPELAIQASTTSRGVAKPVAMFSAAADQSTPASVILAAKFEPWLKAPLSTIVFVQACAERSSARPSRNGGR